MTQVYRVSKDHSILEQELELPQSGEVFPLSGHAALLAKIAADCADLDDIALTGRGIGAYHHSKHSEEIIENRAFHAAYKKDDSFLPELGGENVGRYEIDWRGNRWIKYGDWLSEPRDPRLFRGERVLSRKILDERLCCTFTDSDWLVDQQVYVAAQFQDGYSALYVTAVLASLLMGFYSRKKFHEEGLFPHLRVTQFRVLPIRRIDFTTPADQRQRLAADGIAQAAEWIASTAQPSVKSIRFSAFSDSTLAHWLDHRLSTDPEQGDVIHDLLAHLAERMIAMHQQKHDRTEAFWLDLEGVTGPDTFEDLREHGKWEASLWKAEPCRPFVDQDSRSTRHLDDSLAWNESCFKPFVKMLAGRVSNLSDLVAVYRAHHPPYHALVRRIEATDRLIDLIVYRLYALTADEVAVVEGNR
jgi:hypothetical protein